MTPEQQSRYLAACHAMQSAVATMISTLGDNRAGADHKHLRTGINAAMTSQDAVVRLLIAKGVFTMEEYEDELVDAADREAERMRLAAIETCGLPPNTKFA